MKTQIKIRWGQIWPRHNTSRELIRLFVILDTTGPWCTSSACSCLPTSPTTAGVSHWSRLGTLLSVCGTSAPTTPPGSSTASLTSTALNPTTCEYMFSVTQTNYYLLARLWSGIRFRHRFWCQSVHKCIIIRKWLDYDKTVLRDTERVLNRGLGRVYHSSNWGLGIS